MSKMQRTIHILQEFSVPLIFGVLTAVAWANANYETYHHAMHWSPFGEQSHLNFHFLMNDILMALFFGIAAKEITESCLPGGALNPMKKAINPLLGTLGGVFGPIGAYFAYIAITGAEGINNGWGIPTATDIALAWLVAKMVFGKGHPAISFLLLLAIADDAIGLGIIAVFYPDPTNPVQLHWMGLAVLACIAAYVMRKKYKVKSFWPYILGPGVLCWFGFLLAHLHPALGLVPIIPFLPNMKHDEGLYEEEGDGHHHNDALNKFEHTFKLPVDFGLFGFGLANAGVVFSDMGHATWAVLSALVIGKTVGIFGFSAIGHWAGFKLPNGMNLRGLFMAGFIAALGLTVALFVAGVAFTDPALQGAAKMGALFSAGVAPIALLLGGMLGVHLSRKKKDNSKGTSKKAA